MSYSDVRFLNNTWAQEVTEHSTRKIPPGFVKGRDVHVTIDNSDGKLNNLTGSHTKNPVWWRWQSGLGHQDAER